MSKQRLRRGAATGQGETGGGEGRIPPPSTNLHDACRQLVQARGRWDMAHGYPVQFWDALNRISQLLEEDDE